MELERREWRAGGLTEQPLALPFDLAKLYGFPSAKVEWKVVMFELS